eukprot:6228972-Amphidinium_carterae.1
MDEDSVPMLKAAVQNVKQHHQEFVTIGHTHEQSQELNRMLFGIARRAKTCENAVRMFSLLVDEFGISVNVKDRRSRQSPLFYASSVGSEPLVQFFLDKNADANHLDFNLQTPLFYAARAGHTECVRSLMERHASPEQVDVNGQTAIFYAAGSGHVNCLSVLLTAEGVKAKDKHGRTPLFYAADSPTCGM